MEDKVLQIIGAEIQIYGYFDSYSIPYESGESIVSESAVTRDEFIRLTYEYFTNKKRINTDYDDALEQNAIKRFILDHVDDESLDIGKEWISRQKFKI